MKKLIERDKKVRKNIKKLEKKKFIFKLILNNMNLPYLLRFNASNNLSNLTKKASKTLISNRCIATVNKKKIWKTYKLFKNFFFKTCSKQKNSWYYSCKLVMY